MTTNTVRYELQQHVGGPCEWETIEIGSKAACMRKMRECKDQGFNPLRVVDYKEDGREIVVAQQIDRD